MDGFEEGFVEAQEKHDQDRSRQQLNSSSSGNGSTNGAKNGSPLARQSYLYAKPSNTTHLYDKDTAGSSSGNGKAGAKDGSCRWDRCNFLSRYLFLWTLPVLRLAHVKNLTLDDLDGPQASDRAAFLGARLEQSWKMELANRLPRDGNAPMRSASLVRAIIRTFGAETLVLSIIIGTIEVLLRPLAIISLGWLIKDAAIYGQASNYLSTQALLSPSKPSINDTTTITATNAPYPFTASSSMQTPQVSSADFAPVVADAAWMLAALFSISLFAQPYFFAAARLAMKMRMATMQLIYRKSLRLNQAALTETTVGQMLNMLSADVSRFDQATFILPYIIVGPLQAVVLFVVLSVSYIGVLPTLASVLTLLVFVAGQTLMGKGFSAFRSKTAARTDERARLMSELISAMRVIKMYAWEHSFDTLVSEAREREMAAIFSASLLKGTNQGLFFISSKLTSFVAFIVYLSLADANSKYFKPEVVFVSLGLTMLMRFTLTLMFPNAIAGAAELLVSCKRIAGFLELPEVEQRPANYLTSGAVVEKAPAVCFVRATAAWTQQAAVAHKARSELAEPYASSSSPIFKDLSLSLKPRELLLIVGRVGAGKSSVLNAMIGELPVASGLVQMNGRISYASQEPWIFSGTVRDNILFGLAFDGARFARVARACSLDKDLAAFVDGASTVVGERGVSLSGGQKARVSLARALYREADIYLLDDPLSAVDAPVARHIFERCLQTFLRTKTVVLVTHQLQFLRFASKVLVVGGQSAPAAFGTVEQVTHSEAFAALNYGKHAFQDATATGNEPNCEPAYTGDHKRAPKSSASSGASSANSSPPTTHSTDTIRSSSRDSEAGIGKELSGKVSVNVSTYSYYARMASGLFGLCLFGALNFGAQFCYLYIDYYLSLWTDSEERKEFQGASFKPTTFVDSLSYSQTTGLYATLTVLLTVLAFARAASFYAGAKRASINIHRKLLRSVLFAPLSFFDSTPVGILLSRFTSDMNIVDDTISQLCLELFLLLFNLFGILILSMLIDWRYAPAVLALLLACRWIIRFASRAICRLKQLEGAARSPIYSHVSTTVSGLATIRALKAERNMQLLFEGYANTSTKAFAYSLGTSRWLAFAADWTLNVYILVLVVVLLVRASHSTNASQIGLLLSQTTALHGPFPYATRQLIDLNSYMTSVQRIKDYSSLEPEEGFERDFDSRGAEPASSQTSTWSQQKPPDGGAELRVRNVSLSYFADEAPVLREVSFEVMAGERVAVVGRTGAGKSSLVSVLFRLYQFEGAVELDGVDTKQLPLGALRSRVSIIPQEPVLFAASVRKNLDPTGEHTDEQLQRAIDTVQLRAQLPSLEFGVAEAGANLSVGQRQLVCLARAIVRRNKLLVLDEATANVDPETDAYIQAVIEREFARCTLITIAHRLITVAGADKVLVMDGGRVAEFGPPSELLASKTSQFAAMVAASLDAKQIERVVAEAAELRSSRRLALSSLESRS